MKTCILYNSNRVNEETIRRFKKLQSDLSNRTDFDFKWCLDTTLNNFDNLPQDINFFKFNINDIRNLPHIYFDSFKWYEPKTDRTFMWLNSDNYVLLDKRITSDYDYVWMIEYDVCYSGNWNTFFDIMDSSSSDFVSHEISDIKNFPSWGWPKFIEGSRTSDLPFYGNLMCLCRASKKCINCVDEFLRNFNTLHNYHHELTWPTAAIRYGLTYENIDKYCHDKYWCGPASIDYEPNKLYHSVKDFIRWIY